MSFKIYVAFGVSLCAVIFGVTGCGASNSPTSGGSSSASNQNSLPTITKAELIKRGDVICARTDKRQVAALKSYEAENPVKPTTRVEIEKSLEAAALPPIATEIEELEELGMPAKGKARVQAILSGLNEAQKDVEELPGLLLASPEGPFAGPDKLAAAYGFKACAKAL